MGKKPVIIIREYLQTYADRGIFRGFSESNTGNFHFVWLMDRPMEMKVDVNRHILRFNNLLPGIPNKSRMYTELREFIELRHNPQLPDHRRIDRKMAAVYCRNQGGNVSLSIKVSRNEYAYAVNRIVNLVHELFVHLRVAYPQYLMENFDVPEE